MIKSIDKSSVHRITSGQVLVDLQTAVKELVENSLDAGATTIDIKFKEYGLASFEVSDNGSGITPEDYDSVAMKHYTSKLTTFDDLTTVQTFGFRGEALSSLCALSERVTITTATSKEAPMGTILEFDRIGRVKSRSGKAARQRGTTVYIEGLFVPLPVRRKELQRNSKREFGKALTLLSAYALVPCTKENKGVRLSVVHFIDKGRKSDQIRTDGKPSLKASISSLWGPKQVESLAELNLDLEVVPEKAVLRRQANVNHDGSSTKVQVRGFISKFSSGHGRASSDRQFFFINGRPCNPSKIQKAFNEVYRSFNTNQSPFIVADFIVPPNNYDINVSPDKRTILLHSETALVAALKEALETAFAPTRSTFAVQSTQSKLSTSKSAKTSHGGSRQDISGSGNGSLDVSADQPDFEGVVEHDVDGHESVEFPATLEGATQSLAVPASLLGSEEAQELSDEVEPAESMQLPSSPTSKPQSPIHPPSGTTAISESSSSSSSCLATSPPEPIVQNVAPAVPVKTCARTVQMVLDTTSASWSMRPVSEEPARKKRKFDDPNSANPRTALRARLLSFASAGSQPIRHDVSGEDSDAGSSEVVGRQTAEMDEVEEDELMGDELDEMEMDPEADLDDEPIANDAPIRESGGSNLTIPHVHGEAKTFPLFLPESVEAQSLDISGQSKNDLIELDTDMEDGSGSILEVNRMEDRRSSTSSDMDETSRSLQSKTTASVEIVRTADPSIDVALPFNLQSIDLLWNGLSSSPKDSYASARDSESPQKRVVTPIAALAGLSNTSDEKSAERELARVINKEDFTSMEIVGQFNLGFIIARRRLRGRKTGSIGSDDAPRERIDSPVCVELDDLFIIDQHAADEKYNFETLQQTTKIDSQKLYVPRPLELTAADELLALENIDVLKNNGFEIIVDENTGQSQGRVKLVAQPVSGNTNFDMKDLEEILHLMQDRPAGQKMVRCSKARAMFAMRACRKSVMIGMALNKSQMTSVVRHMGTIDQPWNCPHGRPTMRHLTSLNDAAVGVGAFIGPSARQINWDDL